VIAIAILGGTHWRRISIEGMDDAALATLRERSVNHPGGVARSRTYHLP